MFVGADMIERSAVLSAAHGSRTERAPACPQARCGGRVVSIGKAEILQIRKEHGD